MTNQELVREQLKEYFSSADQSSVNDSIFRLSGGISKGYDFSSIIEKTLSGDSIFDINRLIDNIFDLLIIEIKSALIFGMQVLIICIAMALLNSLLGTKLSSSVTQAGKFISTLILSGIILTNFTYIYQYALDSICGLIDTMSILFPVILGVLIGGGKLTSGSVLSPLIITITDISSNIVKLVIFPLIYFSIILKIFNGLTEKNYVNQLANIANQGAIYICGIMLTIFSSIISIQGLVSSQADNLLMDTTKYSLSNFIPLVGGFTADTLELFLNCMSTIKGALGAFAIVSIALIVLIPIIKLFVVTLLYKSISIIIEPICDSKFSSTISSIGTSYFILGGVVFFIGLMFALFFTIIIGIGD